MYLNPVNLRKLIVQALFAILACFKVDAQVPGFVSPDSICINSPVTISNTSIGGTSFYWSFCDADLTQTPEAANLGNISGILSSPVFVDVVSQNGNYYGFLTDHYPGGLVRLDFGNSLLNVPTAVNLGNFSGAINAGYGTEDIQMVQNNGNWYALIVGGDLSSGGTPRLTQVNFGSDITNPSPIATNWGNLGNMDQSIGFYLFSDNGNWYGFTTNATNNTLTRFDFGNSFDVPPTAVNLGNPGGYFDYPTSVNPLKDPATGEWHVFVTNGNNNSPNALERLDFGTSLLNNNPVAVDLGNPGNLIFAARDIKIIQACDQIIGFIPDGTRNDLIRLNFNGNILSVPTAMSLGNIGNLDFCHSLSKLFRVGPDLYSFVMNVDNNTITRLRFPGCTSSNIPNSNSQNPPTISYSQPGTYHINLIMDDGLSTQSSFCKTIVVKTLPPFSLGNDSTLCQGDSLLLTYPASDPTVQYLWQDGTSSNNYMVRSTGEYKLVVKDRSGCSAADSVSIGFTALPTVKTIPDTAICSGNSLVLESTVLGADSIKWAPAASLSNTSTESPVASPAAATSYIVTAYHQSCPAADTVAVNVLPNPVMTVSADTLVCQDSTLQLFASGASRYEWYPSKGMSDNTVANPFVTPDTTGYYYVKGTAANACFTLDSVLVRTKLPAMFSIYPGKSAICVGDSTKISLQETNGAPGDGWLWISDIAGQDPSGTGIVVSPSSTAVYQAVAFDRTCRKEDTLTASVAVNPSPALTVTKSNDIDCIHGQATLTVTGGVAYNWSPAGTLTGPESATPTASTDTTTLYYVKATGENGCMALDSILVNVSKSRGGGAGFPVANAFTPNGDGVNDCFGIKYWGYIGEFEMSVFNRWGLRVFYSRHSGDCWDGTFDGKPQPAGTYVYMIKAFALCGEAFRRGTVELIR